MGTPIGTPPNIVFAGFYKKLFPDNPDISFFKWMTLALPIVLVFIPLTWFYLYRIISPFPFSQLEVVEDKIIQKELDKLGVMSRAEKIVASIFCMTAFLWIFRRPIIVGDFIVPGWSALFEDPQFLHDSTVAMTMGILLLLFPVNGSKGLNLNGKIEWFALDWKTVQTKTPWGILILFGGGFALAAGFGTSGLDKWLGEKLTGVSDWPLWLTVLVICLAVTFLTELTSNTATTTVILPILGMAAIAANIHPLFLMVPATLAASFAFMLPVATPPNAIVFGSGWVSMPKMSKAGLVLNLIGAGIVTTAVLLLLKSLLIES